MQQTPCAADALLCLPDKIVIRPVGNQNADGDKRGVGGLGRTIAGLLDDFLDAGADFGVDIRLVIDHAADGAAGHTGHLRDGANGRFHGLSLLVFFCSEIQYNTEKRACHMSQFLCGESTVFSVRLAENPK